ncbi:MAG TPA: histidine kinase [Polyangiaceae bacterium]|nr:histidine kinase [Polyangiaceae bacterium]
MSAALTTQRPFGAVPRASARQLLAFGYLSPLVLYLAPMSLRTLFGTVTPRYFLSDFVLSMAQFALVSACIMRALLWGTRRRLTTARSVALLFVVSAATMAATNLARHALGQWLPGLVPNDPAVPPGVAFALASAISDSLPLLVCWGGLFLLPMTLRRAERHRAQVASARREAELLRLRAHLEPHFVLNTLNAIAGLVADEPLEARRLIGLLGDLFREATSDRDRGEHALADEIAWLERYAAIHELRHRGLVRFAWHIEPAAARAPVPRLVLQPIVENAVVHGALRRRGGGTVRIAARVEGGAPGARALVCEVEDDGPGFGPAPRRPGASGMRIVERRLALGPPRGTLAVAREGGATRVTLRFDLGATPPPAGAA